MNGTWRMLARMLRRGDTRDCEIDHPKEPTSWGLVAFASQEISRVAYERERDDGPEWVDLGGEA